jgi:hypothetical protein
MLKISVSLIVLFLKSATAYKGEQTFEKANRMPFYVMSRENNWIGVKDWWLPIGVRRDCA